MLNFKSIKYYRCIIFPLNFNPFFLEISNTMGLVVSSAVAAGPLVIGTLFGF